MATSKSAGPGGHSVKSPENAAHQLAFEAAIAEFASAVQLTYEGKYSDAQKILEKIAGSDLDEPELLERARSYRRICIGRMAPAAAEPRTAEEFYNHGVVLTNAGRYDEALELLNRTLQEQPDSARALYARASVWALRSKADAAVTDLRQAIAIDPQLRFQAVNDPDFELVREEPSFIDIIEPTPTGA